VCFLNETIFIIFDVAVEDVTWMQESYGQNIFHNLRIFVDCMPHCLKCYLRLCPSSGFQKIVAFRNGLYFCPQVTGI
jgi:hypothetical protein